MMVIVCGRDCIIFPIIEGQKKSGEKAAMVVTVEAITGMATSAVPFLAASNRVRPLCAWR